MTKFLNIETLKIHWKLKIGNCNFGRESGQILIISIIFLTVMLVLMGALLGGFMHI